jgi:tetratricopeptide (TPR) repeat protein
MFARLLSCFVLLCAVSCVEAAIDLDREIILTAPNGDTPADAEIRQWQQRIINGASVAEYERLGWAFVAKARRTLDPGFYKLAEKTADVMDAQFGPQPEAALLRGHVYHNLHRFIEAENIARRLVEQRGTVQDLALLSDALMEQGKLAEAIVALQRMANIRPGAEADTRIAQIRWLKGDLNGAIVAMEQAARETSAVDAESLAWIYTRLSGFYLQSADLGRAQRFASAALRSLPEFAPALLAEGKVRLGRRDMAAAIAEFARAAELNPLPEYQWWLADTYHLSGDEAKADAVRAEIARHGAAADPRTFSVFLATTRCSNETALTLARAELQTRADVLTHDAVAWAAWADGDITEADRGMRAALAEGTKDPRLLLHASVIAKAAGRVDDARSFFAACERGAAALLPSERALLEGMQLDGAALSAPAIGDDGVPPSKIHQSAELMMRGESVASVPRR